MQESFTNPMHGGNLAWAAALVGCSPHAILDFSASINPLGPPASAIAAIHQGIADLPHYPDPEYRVLRQQLGAVHDLPPEWILPGNGSAELLTWAGRELSTYESTYLITPAFSDYDRALQTFAAIVKPCPFDLTGITGTDPSSLQPESLPVTLASLGATIASSSGVLLNNPHNPTGRLFARDAILPLLEQFALVVVDEAFMDFLRPEQDQSVVSLVPRYPNLVVLRSLTKFYSLPGLRLGYAIAHPDRLRQWQQWRDPWTVNVLAEAAARAVLSDHEFQNQTWQWLETARSPLFHGLAALPGLFPCPSAANFLLVQSENSVVSLQRALLQRHQILIRDCISFPELGDQYFRVAIRTPSENERLLTGLADLQGNGEFLH